MNFIELLEKINDKWDEIAKIICCICLGVSVLFVSAEVFGRYFLKTSEAFLEEIPLLLLVVYVYLMIGMLLKKSEHIAIDYFKEKMNPKQNLVVSLFIQAVNMLFCLIIIWGLVLTINSLIITGAILPTQIPMPKWVCRVVVPLGLFFLFLRSLELFLKRIRELWLKDKHEV